MPLMKTILIRESSDARDINGASRGERKDVLAARARKRAEAAKYRYASDVCLYLLFACMEDR